jgi:hypothetical protein
MTRPIPLSQRLYRRIWLGDGCWEREGYHTRDGYSTIKEGGQTLLAHRVSYELFFGPIPEGTEIDHLCRNPGCVRPDHLEAVPHVVNVRRGLIGINQTAHNRIKTHCPKGHPYDETNTYISPRGHRRCRACRRK